MVLTNFMSGGKNNIVEANKVKIYPASGQVKLNLYWLIQKHSQYQISNSCITSMAMSTVLFPLSLERSAMTFSQTNWHFTQQASLGVSCIAILGSNPISLCKIAPLLNTGVHAENDKCILLSLITLCCLFLGKGIKMNLQ